MRFCARKMLFDWARGYDCNIFRYLNVSGHSVSYHGVIVQTTN